MPIQVGQKIKANDFINESEKNATPANDAGKVVKLESDGQISKEFVKKHIRFGGTGADGALSISSGTTTINLGGVQLYVLNYSSISITGTGVLAFSNPHANGTTIIIKCKGNCTLTSSATPMIDGRGLGANGGGSVSRTSEGSTNGNVGSNGLTYSPVITRGASDFKTGGAVVNPTDSEFWGGIVAVYKQFLSKYSKIFVGAGGGSGQVIVQVGSGGSVTSGAGGKGGGCLIMEVNGYLNFTTANGISVSGINGGNATAGGTKNEYGGGGGGGGGGMFILLYNYITSSAGSVNVAGGIGGNYVVRNYAGSAVYGGGGGGSGRNAGANGTLGGATDGVKTGGDGGAGFSLIELNTEFA
jgi:hypothetical protein